jgi:tetratricopeptide (TPR) repeat protein
MELWSCRSAKNICHIVELSHKAIAEDPRNADAFGILACAYIWSAYGDIVPASRAFLSADMALRKALKLNPRSTSALAAQAWLTLCSSRDQALAEVQFRECLAAFPDQSFALTGLAITCLIQHKFAEATDLANRARNADPLSPSVTYTSVGLLYYMGRFDRVIVEGRIACSIGHASPALGGLIGLAFAALGQGSDAIKELKDAANVYPTSLFVQGALGCAYGIFSHKKEAEAILAGLIAEQSNLRSSSAYAAALACAGLHDGDQALHWIEKGEENLSIRVLFLELEWAFAFLRNDERFQAIAERMRHPIWQMMTSETKLR